MDSEPESPILEQTYLHKAEDTSRGIDPQFRYGRAQGETCASCAFTVPLAVASKLPKGAPGSLQTDDKAKNTAPVLRSREFICLAQPDRNRKRKTQAGQSCSQDSSDSSFHSYGSQDSHRDCHDHKLTYLTTKSPDNPVNYAQLRASVIRTLSFEQLPKGMSDGPLYFGDDESGYTIAYVFRLTDPKARGRRRAYAFVALAGNNASRAFKACPMLWEAFATMANRIEQAAQRYQEEQKKKEEEEDKKRNFTPVTSFLTQRAVDPDGHVRRAGQITPRSLADIVGDENIFAILHQYFVAVLRCLGEQFGGLPVLSEPKTYQPYTEEDHDEKLGMLHGSEAVPESGRSTQPIDEDMTKVKQAAKQRLRQSSLYNSVKMDATNHGQIAV